MKLTKSKLNDIKEIVVKHYLEINPFLTLKEAVELCGHSKKVLFKAFEVNNWTEIKDFLKNDMPLMKTINLDKDAMFYKQKYKDVKRINEMLMKQLSDLEGLFSEISYKTLPLTLNINKNDSKLKRAESHDEHVQLLGDWHVGENVSSEKMLGFGYYNEKVFIKRLQHCAAQLINECYGKVLDKLHIVMMGDMLTGMIHEELSESPNLLLADAFIVAFRAFIHYIEEIRPFYKKIEINGVPGNHGRFGKKVKFKNKFNNIDYIFYKMIESHFDSREDASIEVNIQKAPMFLKKIHNKNFLFLHGDNIRSWGGIPFYGISRAHASLTSTYSFKNTPIDYMILGHFHNSSSMQHFKSKRIINGSMMGNNEFSFALGLGSSPEQKLLLVEEEYGVRRQVDFILDHPSIYDSEIRWNVLDGIDDYGTE